jgi:putative flippase GtrA
MTISKQFLRFVAVGGVATAIHYAILVLLVQLEIAAPVMASTIGFAVSAVFNYALNRVLTFRSRRRHVEAFPRFALAASTGLGLNAICVWLLLATGVIHYLVAQMVATGVTLVWNFTINRLWTFRNDGVPPGAPRGSCS